MKNETESMRLVHGGGTKRAIPRKPRAPRCPSFLGPVARAEWRRLAGDLVSRGLLTNLDRAAFAIYCQAWEHVVHAQELVARHGLVSETEDGSCELSPYLGVLNDATEMLTRVADELGLTPASRTRIGLPGKSGEHDGVFDRHGRPK